MIIINLTGGLGNQMFQYAFGKYIATINKTDLKYHYTSALFNTPREFNLGVFKITGLPASNEDLSKLGIARTRVLNRLFYLIDERYGIQLNNRIVTESYPYVFNKKYFGIKDNTYIQGYWANEKYFKDIDKTIRNEYEPLKQLDKRNIDVLNKIRFSSSISIHIRRTDYVTNKKNIPKFIGLEYYINSIKKIRSIVKNPKFFVFSDDISWCRNNLKGYLSDEYFIDYNKGRDSYKDLFLMSACKHNIIANSTFSWWASYLNRNKNKICIKP